jgi:hypothetical protein
MRRTGSNVATEVPMTNTTDNEDKDAGMEPLTARRTWRTAEMIHGFVYFAPENMQAYAALGLSARPGYFASRSAPMGAASAELVIATFFNFEPAHVRRSMAGVWDTVTPATLLDARRDAAGAALHRILGPEVAESPDVEEAAALARRAAEAACALLSGKPLFAGHASLSWPDEPLLVLWHAQSLLREFRGDIHIAAMTAEGIDGCEALVTHAATGEITREILQGSRVWSDDQWDAAVESLRAKGHLDSEGSFTEKGAESRQRVEAETDAGALVAYEALGDEGCQRLRFLCRPLSQTIAAAVPLTLPR